MIKIINHEDEHVSVMIPATPLLLSQFKTLTHPNSFVVWSENLLLMKTADELSIMDEIELADAFIVCYKYHLTDTEFSGDNLACITSCSHSKIFICTMPKEHEIDTLLNEKLQTGDGLVDIMQSTELFNEDNHTKLDLLIAVTSGIANKKIFDPYSEETSMMITQYIYSAYELFCGDVMSQDSDRLIILNIANGQEELDMRTTVDVLCLLSENAIQIADDQFFMEQQIQSGLQEFHNEKDVDTSIPDDDITEYLDELI